MDHRDVDMGAASLTGAEPDACPASAKPGSSETSDRARTGGRLTYVTLDGSAHVVNIQRLVVPDGVEFGPAHNESGHRMDSQHHQPMP